VYLTNFINLIEKYEMKKQSSINQDWFSSAKTLSEALPYLQRYDNAVVVIKLGGHAMGTDQNMNFFARDIVLMQQVGVNPVIVHGGGPMINEMLKKLNLKSEFIEGKRVTNTETINIVEMVLSGNVNKKIVHAINRQGGTAVGLSGKDANLIQCAPEDPKFGFVGKPSVVNPNVLKEMFTAGIIPVVAPIGVGENGETFNINGDTAAGAIASELKADRLLLLTDVSGVKNNNGEVITELTSKDIKNLVASGVIEGGMIPKVNTALNSLEAGTRAAVILDGRAPNACLLELFTEHGAGSIIRL
tara:strand:+ start:1367 stop:2272 length:906 start_codon:yes stop_codon:yes gene_type:complete